MSGEILPGDRPQPCTVADVRRWLIAAERRAGRSLATRQLVPGDAPVWRWPDLYVADYQTRQYLKAWIWCEAHGESFAALCRERHGWSVRTGARKVAGALRAIVEGVEAG
ncbi:hypothetical protein [Methylobacterium tarhaniae]|uniref:hypothetical protein n=1 Tax=Methylobacterium tarhaniae TaxID=1187852 RepID=UPI003D0836D1